MMNSLFGMIKRRAEQYPPSMRPHESILIPRVEDHILNCEEKDLVRQLRSSVETTMGQSNNDNDTYDIGGDK